VIFLVLNNSMYGTIRLHQERRFPGRVSGTGLVNPDFPLLAKSFGGLGLRVADTAAFTTALNEAITYSRERRRPALIELVCDPDLLTPESTVAALRGAP
jgi:acetolactate synthase-1/2/3 large subunit